MQPPASQASTTGCCARPLTHTDDTYAHPAAPGPQAVCDVPAVQGPQVHALGAAAAQGHQGVAFECTMHMGVWGWTAEGGGRVCMCVDSALANSTAPLAHNSHTCQCTCHARSHVPATQPSNLLLNSECQVKLADFGLARSVAQLNGAAETGARNPVLTDYVATRWEPGMRAWLQAELCARTGWAVIQGWLVAALLMTISG